ncbi:hypothetical protein H740_00827 [Campylobacter showae CC57C]|uniref:Uncharacterized protein n=1 Tax=Campylobacter showae CC57C TaxID=1073353 RepID=M3JDX3_9BACT|nr:hypothetical protein H740_00827 [Campylobacter showae CC57C]
MLNFAYRFAACHISGQSILCFKALPYLLYASTTAFLIWICDKIGRDSMRLNFRSGVKFTLCLR